MIEIVGNPKYKKVYISGPISKIDDDNIPEFEKYSKKLRDLGFDAINPHDLFMPWEIRELKQKVKDRIITEEEMWAICMKRDIPAMLECDFVAVLEGWNKSKGANIEVTLAKDLFMPIVSAETLQELF